MKRCILAIAVLAAFMVSSSTTAQNPEVLRRMSGKWKAMVSLSEGGGRFTVSMADATEVKQPDANSIAFALKQATADHPVFDVRLTFNPAGKNYLVSVKTDGASTVEKIALNYVEGTGFSGNDTLIDIGGEATQSTSP